MNFSNVFKDSLTYPFSDWKRFLNLFILIFLSVVFSQTIIITIVSSLITGGYLIRIIESTLDDKEKLPEFSNMKKLLMDGLRYVIVSIIYGIPVAIVSLLKTVISLGIEPNSIKISFVVSIILGFCINLIFLMGLTNMVHEKTIKGAFQFKRILRLIKELGWKNYLIYLIFYTLIVEGISFAMTLFSLTIVTISPVNITMALENLNSYSFIVFLILQGITSTYILAFDGRLRGLIYPKRDLIPEPDDEL